MLLFPLKDLTRSCETALRWMSRDFTVNSGLDNGLVPSGIKSLPEPMLTQDLYHHMTSLDHNELIAND